MSSRNVYLSADERAAAPTLHRVLKLCASKIAEGHSIATILSEGREAITRGGFVLDYLEARHAETLAPIASVKDGPVRLLVAAKLGTTRLIDNVGWLRRHPEARAALAASLEGRRRLFHPSRAACGGRLRMTITPNAGSSVARPAPCR
jgi:hypothetical protein